MPVKKYDKIYESVRERILNEHIKKLQQMQPRVQKKEAVKAKKSVFEVYRYERVEEEKEQLDLNYEEIQQNIKNEIDFEFNKLLFENQCSDLQLQIFLLEKSMGVQLDEIENLKRKIDWKNRKNKASQKLQPKIKQKEIASSRKYEQVAIIKVERQKHMNLVPNIRIEIEPSKISKKQFDEQKNIEFQVKTLVGYQTVQNIKPKVSQFEKDEHMNRMKNMNQLFVCEKRINLFQNKWKLSRHKQQKKQAKQNKIMLMNQINQFWQKANKFQ